MKNDQAAWGQFDPEQYLGANYQSLRPDDARIVEYLAEFLEDVPRGFKAADIGTGPNLYPSLLLATRAGSISLIEKAKTNTSWLRRQLENPNSPEQWRPFVKHAGMCDNVVEYSALWQRFIKLVEIQEGTIFSLPPGYWDLVTMFFVAESITDDLSEFNRAMEIYFESIRVGGWYFAAFMEGSMGYAVGGIRYPAVPIHIPDIETIASRYSSFPHFDHIPLADKPVRTGYSGMIILKGRRDNT